MPHKQPTETRQAALVAAALALAAERSPAAVTTADLAQAVGITQGAVFRHFESKEAIWVAVIDLAHQQLLGRLQAAADAQAQPLAALRAVFLAHVDFVVAHPGVPRVIFQELQHPEDTPLKARVRQLMQAYRALLTGLLQRAQAAGQLAPGTDLAAAAVLFIGSVQGLVMQSLLSGQVAGMAAQAPQVYRIFHNGVAARTAPPDPSPEGSP
ncbi:TetR family transcriptional regulator [Hydrogenophaga taeniospiralis CCUG 15921]|uniref:TetR family transcriptional regulator n=1 Tax=Hydrogenophaga taeniospiralis CCUG 15921 TaxID=1281780 RepID=A0A9X4SAB5_9BURK|nr:TetR family transcriptional regulator [Hydrogenophaga taeniospiralis]MDG5977765.1 TetR family transcriptional regulator [Hydrogenophaga taeniospiralis CCUG 15921]